MKKVVAVVLVYILICANAYASDLGSAAILAGSYSYWAGSFGATDIAWDTDVQDTPSENGKRKRLFTDDVVIEYDFSTENGLDDSARKIVLFASLHTNGNTAYKQSRILGLFAALEYGKPTKHTSEEIDAAYAKAKEVFDEYSVAMVSNMGKIYNGELVLFRMNEHGRYYITYYDKTGICILVE